MTTVSDPGSPAAQVSDRLPAGAHAEARTRTREGSSHTAAQVAWIQRISSSILTGESLAHRQSPTLAQEWARHRARARSHNAGLLKGPRYVWGLLHMPIAAACDLFKWATNSFPKLAVTVAALYLIHLFL